MADDPGSSGDSAPNPEREHERYEVEIRVDWVSGQMFVSDHVTNIGKGGLFIKSDKPLPKGEVEMVLWLPGKSPVHATGRVVWNADPSRAPGQPIGGAGLSFIDMHPADRALLHDYLRDLSQRKPARGH
jgi:type IV pilus assembly protein PilZ